MKHAVELALRTWPEKTQQSIAEQVGCGQQFVSTVKREFTHMRELTEAPATVTGRDGKTYPTTKPKAPKVKAEQTVCAGAKVSDERHTQPPPDARTQDGVLWALSSLIHDAMIASKRLPGADAAMVEKLGKALEKARGAA